VTKRPGNVTAYDCGVSSSSLVPPSTLPESITIRPRTLPNSLQFISNFTIRRYIIREAGSFVKQSTKMMRILRRNVGF
jgi:hypothetical protein